MLLRGLRLSRLTHNYPHQLVNSVAEGLGAF